MNRPLLRWHHFSSTATLTDAVTARIAADARKAIAANGRFLIVLAGGSTPRDIYVRLAGEDLPWRHWHVYFGDERCLPAENPRRNDSMAKRAWLDTVPIPSAQIHAIPAEQGADAAASAYARQLAGVGHFDLVLLGLGEDGHTASLFAEGQGLTADSPDAVAVHDAPKPPASRVSMSAGRLSRSDAIYLIVTGDHKRDALERLRRGDALPIRSLNPARGIDVFTDQPVDQVAAT